jgi:hypothetical protein
MFFSWRYLFAPDVSDFAAQARTNVQEKYLTEVPDSPTTLKLLEELEQSSDRGSMQSADEPGGDISLHTPSFNESQAILDNADPTAKVATNFPYDEEGNGICYWVGPIAKDTDWDVLTNRLRSLKIDIGERQQRITGVKRYWVYLPPSASKAQAKEQLAEVQKLGIDSYLIPNGEHQNGISLGLFSQKVIADNKIKEVATAGWNPMVEVYERSVTQRWVTISKTQLDAVGKGILPRMLKNKSGVDVFEKKCELPVASHNNIQ